MKIEEKRKDTEKEKTNPEDAELLNPYFIEIAVSDYF